jgi:hypothetical protein
VLGPRLTSPPASILHRHLPVSYIATCQYGGRGGSKTLSVSPKQLCGPRRRSTLHTTLPTTKPVISTDGLTVAATHEPQECCIEAETRRRMHHAHSPKNILHGHAAILLPMSTTLCAGGELGHHRTIWSGHGALDFMCRRKQKMCMVTSHK